MTTPPPLSITLPVYNGRRYLAAAIRGLLDQSFGDFELLVLDNASTDDTAAIALDFSARDARVRYVCNDRNLGCTGNFHKAFALARGEFHKWAAADDVCETDYLAACMRVLRADPSVVLAYTRTTLIDERGRAIGDDPSQTLATDHVDPARRFAASLRETWCFAIFGVMRAEALRRTTPFPTYYGWDKVLLAEMSLLGRFTRDERRLFRRRCHEEQSTSLPDTAAKAVWATGTTPAASAATTWRVPRLPRLPYSARMFGDYFRRAWRRPELTAGQRARCLTSAAGMVVHPDKWRKLLLPGPHNYLGWHGIEPQPRPPGRTRSATPAAAGQSRTISFKPIL